jgi:hypothetical protein
MSVHIIEYRDFEIRIGIFEVLPSHEFVNMVSVIQHCGDAVHEYQLSGGPCGDPAFFDSEESALAHSLDQGRSWVDRKAPLLEWLARFGRCGPDGAQDQGVLQ